MNTKPIAEVNHAERACACHTMKYRIETTWRNASGEMQNGSDERVISEHETLQSAINALLNCDPSHPHNFAQIIDDSGRIISERAF